MSRIPTYHLNDYLATDIQDGINRQYISQSQDNIAIDGSFLATNRGRIKALTMTGTTDTTLELYINNQPQFVSGQPSVVGRTYDNPSFYKYNRGDVIKVSRVAGLGTGGTVALDTEAHELIKRTQVFRTPARQRLTRAAQKTKYLVTPQEPKTLVTRYGSLAAAASGIQTALTQTEAGGIANAEGNPVDPLGQKFFELPHTNPHPLPGPLPPKGPKGGK